VRDTLNVLPDVLDIKVSVSNRTAFIEHWSTLDAQSIVHVLNEKHLGSSLQERSEAGAPVERFGRRSILRVGHAILQVALFFLGTILSSTNTLGANVAYGACIGLSYPLFNKAWIAVLGLRANVEFLMATAMAGSLLQQELMEAAMVGALVTLMDCVTWVSVAVVDRRLGSAISIPPSTISLQGGTTIVASELKAGMIFLVRTGDGIPADGTVAKGRGAVDESRITGEAVPVEKERGDKVQSGSILQSGFLEVKADTDVDCSFQAKVLESVQQAKNTLSNTQAIVSKFAAWYTPAVILIAALVAIVQWDLMQFLVIIVAGCPCALLGAAPFVQAASLAVLAKRHHLLVKATTALESLARVSWLGIDKTGTITTGKFRLIKLKSVSEFAEKELHQWAAAIETRDPHPLAQSLVQSYTGCVTAFAGWDGLPEVTRFKREGRCGVRGVVEGRTIGVGNSDFLKSSAIPLEGQAAVLSMQWSAEGTILFVTVNQTIGGVLLLDDPLRPDAKDTIEMLKSLGIQPALLTGDKRANAARAALAAGVEAVHAGLLPEDKARLLLQASWRRADAAETPELEKGLLGRSKRGPVVVGFVGDGLNDCLALANAHVGIALQEVGSRATVDAAAAVLQGDLGQLPAAVIVARRTQLLVWANIILALMINAITIVAAATVGIPLWLSVVMDSSGLLAVLANSLWPLCWRVPGATSST